VAFTDLGLKILSNLPNYIGGIMGSVIALSAVDCGLSWQEQ
jgi:hypothetical protein